MIRVRWDAGATVGRAVNGSFPRLQLLLMLFLIVDATQKHERLMSQADSVKGLWSRLKRNKTVNSKDHTAPVPLALFEVGQDE